MVEAKAIINNPTGLHARPASEFIKFASKFVDSEIIIAGNGKEGNGKSILNIMSLGLGQGSEITIRVSGGDEQDTVTKLVAYIQNLTD